jgi:membrane protease YdiL (CAAX protease family)
MIDRRPLYWFLCITFVFSWSMFLVPLAFRSDPSTYARMATLFRGIGMWGPGIAAIVVTLAITREPLSRLRLTKIGPLRYYLAAWLVPPLLIALTIGLSVLIGSARFDPDFTTLQQLAHRSSEAGRALSVEQLLLVQLAQGLILGPVLNVYLTMGEELGWRGFLLPRLMPLGQWRALGWVGVIWGLWHAPIILQGYNYPRHPVLGVLLMTVFCTFMSFIIGWIYLRTRSPWSAAVAHSALNAWAALPLLFLVPGFDRAVGGMVLSLTGFIVLALFVALLIARKALPVPVPKQEGESS